VPPVRARPVGREAADRARVLASRQTRTGWLVSLPAVVVVTLLTLVPIVMTLRRAVSAGGLDAGRDLLDSPVLGQVLRNTAEWTVLSVAGALVVGYGAALLLQHRAVRAKGLVRSLLLVPWVAPQVVAATIWSWFLSRDFGLLNRFLETVGLIDEPLDWLSNTSLVLPTLAMVQVWATFPFVMLLVSAGLQAIPGELYEAARLDGAGPTQIFRHIVLPSLRDITFIVLLITIVWAFNAFAIIWLTTSGGPANASTILGVLLYRAFQQGDMDRVAVVAMLQLVVSMVFAFLYVRRTRAEEA
jgi:multiple sugar transport system permease protein